MNDAVDGSKYFVSALNGDQMVVPEGASESPPQRKDEPPHSGTSNPRCFAYHSPSALGSCDLKKIPPIPVTRSMWILLGCG